MKCHIADICMRQTIEKICQYTFEVEECHCVWREKKTKKTYGKYRQSTAPDQVLVIELVQLE